MQYNKMIDLYSIRLEVFAKRHRKINILRICKIGAKGKCGQEECQLSEGRNHCLFYSLTDPMGLD